MPPPLSLVLVAAAEAERAVFFPRIQSPIARSAACTGEVDADRKTSDPKNKNMNK